MQFGDFTAANKTCSHQTGYMIICRTAFFLLSSSLGSFSRGMRLWICFVSCDRSWIFFSCERSAATVGCCQRTAKRAELLVDWVVNQYFSDGNLHTALKIKTSTFTHHSVIAGDISLLDFRVLIIDTIAIVSIQYQSDLFMCSFSLSVLKRLCTIQPK